MASKVYFTKDITPENVLRLYELLDKPLGGRIAAKVHTGEAGNQNYIHPEFMKPIIDKLGATVVECNTAYDGARNYSDRHLKLIADHGWSKYFTVDLLDEEGPDLILPISGGKVLKENHVGKDLANYDSMIVLSHFKGHPMGGYGGALKQLSIGCASSAGKTLIHTAGKVTDQKLLWDNVCDQDIFLEGMADAAKSVVEFFKGNVAYVNIMANLSVDCDCCEVAEDPCMADIGILASVDPVAVDQACIDFVYNSSDKGRDHLVERIETRHGIHTIEAAAELGIGSREYELINAD